MTGQNHPSAFKAWVTAFCTVMLVASAAEAQKKLKPGQQCELKEKITVRNKAQRKNVKTRQLDKGSSLKIVRYHRVWVRIQTDKGIEFATPKAIRRNCNVPEKFAEAAGQNAASKASPPAVEAAQSVSDENPKPVEAKKNANPATEPPKPTQPKANPSSNPTNPVESQAKLQVPNVQVPDLSAANRRVKTRISPAAWVALGAGAASMGASAYFVTQLTTQNEATTGQAALLTGATGIIGIIIGLSYVLSPQEVVSTHAKATQSPISAVISVGPGSVSVSGEF